MFGLLVPSSGRILSWIPHTVLSPGYRPHTGTGESERTFILSFPVHQAWFCGCQGRGKKPRDQCHPPPPAPLPPGQEVSATVRMASSCPLDLEPGSGALLGWARCLAQTHHPALCFFLMAQNFPGHWICHLLCSGLLGSAFSGCVKGDSAHPQWGLIPLLPTLPALCLLAPGFSPAFF